MENHDVAENPAWVYERFFVPVLFRPWAEALVDRTGLRRGDRILDLACGTGIVSRVVRQRLGHEAHVSGLDVNPNMLEVAREQIAMDGVRVDLHQGNAADLPFPDRALDVVLIQQGLQFFPDRPAALAEVRRALDDDGRVGVVAWADLNRQPFSMIEAKAVEKHLGSPAMDTPFALGDQGMLRALFEDAGFVDIAIESHIHQARYPSADQYFETIVIAASAAVPSMQSLDANQRSMLVEAVKSDMEETIRAHSDGQALVYPVEVNILTARKGPRT